MENIIVLGFYKYVDVGDSEKLQANVREFCKEKGILGRILLGVEGINGSISGTREQIDAFREFLVQDERFSDIYFKEEACVGHPFKKLKVIIKKELVPIGVEVDLANTGEHISSEEFLELYDENGELKENVVLLDARNDYEYKVGKFKGAIELEIGTFRDFPAATKKIDNLKDKKVVMYCTGGIRCEKASAYLKEKGFSDVSQLNMGVINFGKEKPNSVWEGKCFVFDKRLQSSMQEENAETLTNCTSCGIVCDHMRDCRGCNDFIFLCPECKDKLMGCCSEECLEKYKDFVRAKQRAKMATTN